MIPGFGRGFFYLLRYHTTAGLSPAPRRSPTSPPTSAHARQLPRRKAVPHPHPRQKGRPGIVPEARVAPDLFDCFG